MKHTEYFPLYDGDEHFTDNGMPINKLVSDFWRWCCSDLMNNTMRGALAEFIVASALGISTDNYRIGWSTYDLLYREKIKIEVKSSAYLQSFSHGDLSKIVFNIAPTIDLDEEQQTHTSESIRHSDIYVFCLFKHQDRPTANVTALEQWEFFVCPTSILDERLGAQKTIALSRLADLNLSPCSYGELEAAVDAYAKV